MKKRKTKKSRLTKVDLSAVLELQRKYDELQADCKNLLSVVVALVLDDRKPLCVQFNDRDGYPNYIVQILYDYFRRTGNGKEV